MPSRSKKSSKSRSAKSNFSTARISGQFEGQINAAGSLHISQGARCKANVRASDVKVEGSFEGNIAAQNSMSIGSSARCKGSVHASSLHVDGVINGQAFVNGRMDLSPSAQMQGHIVASRLVVADGASFDGRCTIGKFVSNANNAARKAA